MNHIAHFLVAWGDQGLTAGALLADRTKGRLAGQFPAALERGIALHRVVDAWTDAHAEVRAAAQGFERRFRRYGPIMTDVIFDHFLARDWEQYGPCPLPEFADNAQAAMESWGDTIPDNTRAAMSRMHKNRTLEKYADAGFVADVLAYIGTRMRRSNPLVDAGAECFAQEKELVARFEILLPELLAFTSGWRAQR